MKNWWIRFGCFLIGYNYNIIQHSSEISAKAVKRYTAAIMIVCILWAFIGYIFTNRYMHGGNWGSIFGALLFVTIIIQIERQIILTINPSKMLYLSRAAIAIIMAIIGSIIIDQIIFKEDIDLEKITFIEARVKKALPPKTQELRFQITSLETAILNKELERSALISDISKNPTSVIYSNQPTTKTEKRTIVDTLTGKSSTIEKSIPIMVTSSSNVSNPKISFIAPIEQNISDLRNQKIIKEAALLNIRPQIEKDISSKVGFLDELEVMYTLISRSNVALGVWLLWFFFLFGLEMLVLLSKANDVENDYEKTVKHHMDLQMRKLDLFNKMAVK